MAKKINVDGNFKKKLGKTVNKVKKQSKVVAKDVAAKRMGKKVKRKY